MKRQLNSDVYVAQTNKHYPDFPYDKNSKIYEALQQIFSLRGLDAENPFAGFIQPGETALIKPNWVRDYNPLGYDIESLISHSSLIKYLIDFLACSLRGRGKIIVADAPVQSCNFDNLIKKTRINEIIALSKKEYPRIHFIVEDWRLTKIKGQSQKFLDKFDYKNLDTHQVVDIGRASFLEDVAEYSDRFRVTCYKPSLMSGHHAFNKHEYLITNRVSEANFIINIAKMKTHIKAGLTGALKNIVGINGRKEFLPHHIKGSYLEGGDNYCMPNWLKRKYEDFYDYHWEYFTKLPIWRRKANALSLQALWKLSCLISKDNISAGSWRGNETIWRTALDLNHWLYFMNDGRPRMVFNIVDGIVAGEGEGPLKPAPRPTGLLIGGDNPAYVDAVMGKLMGYNISRIPTVYNAIYNRRSLFAGPFLDDYKVCFTHDMGGGEMIKFQDLPNLKFKKPRYW